MARMIARSKFLSDFAGAAATAMGISATVGALWAVEPASGLAPGLVIGASVALALIGLLADSPSCQISTTDVPREWLRSALPGVLACSFALWAPSGASLLVVLPGSGPALLLCAALGAGAAWAWARAGTSAWWPSGRALVLAGVLVPVLALGLLPRVGGAVLAGLATTSWLAAAWLGSPTGATSTRDERPDVAFAAGLALGAVPLVHLAAIPWLSPDPALLAWLLGGVVLGVGAGRELPKLSGPVTVALPALGLAAAADLLPRMPTMVEVAHLRFGEPEALLYQLPGVLLGAVGLVIGLGGGRARVTARFTWGVTAGMAAWLILPPLIGVGPALYVAAILAACGAAPAALGQRRASTRLAYLAGPILAIGTAFLPAPEHGSLLPHAPWRLYPHPIDLEAARRASARATIVQSASWTGGASVALVDDAPLRAQRAGAVLSWEERAVSADRFFGHLPLLLLPEPPVRVGVTDLGTGATVDAVRRASPARIVVESRDGWARFAALHSTAVRAMLADPAVQLRAGALTGAGPFDAILVEVPPAWTIGAGARSAPRRVRALAQSLSPGGLAAFRVTLGDASADDLARLAGAIGAEFETVVAWLDPQGAEHLILTAWVTPGRVPVANVLAGFTRPRAREALREAGLEAPIDVLERALTDRSGLALLAESSRGRDAAGAAFVGGARVRRARDPVALGALASSGRGPDLLFDLSGIPEEQARELEARLEESVATRATYLKLLAFLAAGKSQEALAVALELSQGSANPARDLRALVGPWLRRGQARLAAGQYEAARVELTTALRFSPDDREVRIGLARALRGVGSLDEALGHAEALIEAHPTDIEAILLLADLRVAQGDLAGSLRLLEQSEPLHPGNERLLTNLAYLLTQLASGPDEIVQRRLSRARELFQRASALAPRMPQPRAGLAEVYYRIGEHDLALRQIDLALTMEESCHYRSARGHILAARKELPAAEAELQQALLACPEAIDALVMLGAVLAEQRKFVEARQSWERALAVDPQSEAAKANLAALEAQLALESQRVSP